MPRFRNLSINEEDFQEATDGKSEAGDGDPFRPRSRSAPPAFWAAKKYGRELRRMSDEFDKGVVDKGVKDHRSNRRAKKSDRLKTILQGSKLLADLRNILGYTDFIIYCQSVQSAKICSVYSFLL